MVMSESQTPRDDGSYPPGQHPDLPPPPGTVGLVGWLRANLFSGPINSIATVATAVLLYLVIVPMANWAVVDAVASGSDRRVCDLGRTSALLGENIRAFSAADHALDAEAPGLSEREAARAKADQRAAQSLLLGIPGVLGTFLDRHALSAEADLVPDSLRPVMAQVRPEELKSQLDAATEAGDLAAVQAIHRELLPLAAWGDSYDGACWVVVKERFTLFMVGFYDRDQLWRPLLAFAGLLLAVPPLLFTAMPFRSRLLWFAAGYPFLAYWLLTGVELADGPLRLFIGLLLLIAAVLPLAWSRLRMRQLLPASYVLPSVAMLAFFAFGPQPLFGFDSAVERTRVTAAMAAANGNLTEGQAIDLPGGLVTQFLSGELFLLGFGLAPVWWVVFALLFAWGLRRVLRHARGEASEAEWRSGRPLVLIAGALSALLLFNGGDVGPDGMFLRVVGTDRWGGLLATLITGVVGITASLPLGIVLALGRRSRLPVVRALSVAFIETVRGVPLITILFMSSVMLPLFLPEGVNFDKLLRALIGVALFASAYLAEVVRGGLQAIPKGQYEAADALGLTYWKTMRLIILPQALKIVIPGIVNTFIGLFKDTTLLGIIGILDLLQVAKSTNSDANWIGFFQETYVFVGAIFFVFCFTMSRYSIYLEKKLETGHRRR